MAYKAHNVIRILFLLISSLICICYELHAQAGVGCNKDCGDRCPGGAYIATSDSGGNPIVCGSAVEKSLGLGNVAVGWAENCALYPGGTSVSDKSCLATGNIIGEVLDTIASLGIDILTRRNFCSFAPGNSLVEGGLIHKDTLKNACNKGAYSPQDKILCTKCFFQGKVFDGQKCIECENSCDRFDGDQRVQCTKCSANALQFNANTGKCEYCPSPVSRGDGGYVVPPSGDDRNNPASIQGMICDNAIPNLDKPLLDQSGRQVFIADGGGAKLPVFCPLMRCNIPTNNIKIEYMDDLYTRFLLLVALVYWGGPVVWAQEASIAAASGDCCDIQALAGGESRGVGLFGMVQVKAEIQADQICASIKTGFLGWNTIACKPRVPPKTTFPDVPCLFTGTSCSAGITHSRWFLPLTSKLMECTTQVFNKLFGVEDSGCMASNLLTFQQNMKSIVRILLVLYVIIVGIQVAFGQLLSKKELFAFILKFALVVFFSVGNLYDTQSSSDEDKNGLLLIRDLVNSGMVSFSEMVIEAAGPVCNFANIDYSNYPNGESGKDYSYLKIWDAIDCRLAFYVGLASPTAEGLAMAAGGGGTFKIGRGLMQMLWGFLFSWQLPLMIFMLAFTIFLLSMVVHFVHLYILAMIAVSILIFFGPIFIPLALFKITKSYCDKWINLLIGYSLQPVMVLAVITVMILTFDKIMFTNCNFNSSTIADNVPYWEIENPSPTCQLSLGYIVSQFSAGSNLTRASVSTKNNPDSSVFYYNTAMSGDTLVALLEGLMFGTFFAFLFYFFAGQMNALASELSGAPDLGKYAVGATALVDMALDAVSGGNFSKAKDAIEKSGAGSGTQVTGGGSGASVSRGGTGSGSSASGGGAGGSGSGASVSKGGSGSSASGGGVQSSVKVTTSSGTVSFSGSGGGSSSSSGGGKSAGGVARK